MNKNKIWKWLHGLEKVIGYPELDILVREITSYAIVCKLR